jgi:cytochrome c-type biogenesis protein CcmF
MGVGPILPWRAATPPQARRRITVPAAAGAATIVLLTVFGMRNLAAVAGFGMAAFVLVANGGEISRGLGAFGRARGVGVLRAVPEAVLRNPRLYGGYLVHLGVAIAVVAIIASTSFARQTEVTLALGQGTSFAGYTLRYEGQSVLRQPQRQVLVAEVRVAREGRELVLLRPSLNLYPGASEPIGTPSIRYGALKDLYSSVIGFDGDAGERATFRFFLNPGVMWLWVGGAIMALGGLLAAWPGRRRVRSPEPSTHERQLAGVRG